MSEDTKGKTKDGADAPSASADAPAVKPALKRTMMMKAPAIDDGDQLMPPEEGPGTLVGMGPTKIEDLPPLLRQRAPHSQRPPGAISSVIPAHVSLEPGTELESSSEPAPDGIQVVLFGQTDVGLVREHNEDNLIAFDATTGTRLDGAPMTISPGEKGAVFAVCDGMGGAAAGEVASQMAVDTVFEVMRSPEPIGERDDFARRLVRAIEEAGARIFAAAKNNKSQRGMGTTSTVAGLVDKVLFVGQVGDSRAYVLRGTELGQITKDQSLITQLIEAGQLTEEEAENFEFSNIILQALGTAAAVQVDLTFLELRRGDRLMLCSDGLSGLVHPQTMRDVLVNCRDPRGACATLIEMARNGGGHDNITVIVADFDGADLPEPGDGQRVAYQQYPLVPLPGAEPKASDFGGASLRPSPLMAPSSVESTDEEARAKSSMRAVAILALLLLLGGVAFWLGRGAAPAAEPAPAAPTQEAQETPAPPAPAPSRTYAVSVRTDIPNAALFVDGEFELALDPAGAKLVSLPAGVYRFEARVDGTNVAEARVAVGDGSALAVELRLPSGAPEAPADPAP